MGLLYNNFASLIQREEGTKQGTNLSNNPDAIIKKWIEHAREYLGLSNYFQNRISINYNEWFTNKAYRHKIAEALGLVFTDVGIDMVPNVGGGSSFDKLNYAGVASRMNVLSRYKAFLDHPIMLKVLANKELNKLSEEIFGSIM